MLTRIFLHQLRCGMYVAQLDCSWWYSPFWRRSFRITSPRQIERLRRAGVRTLLIDTTKGYDIADESTPRPSAPSPELPPPPMPPVFRLTPLSQRAQEFAQAKAARAALEASVSTLLHAIHRDHTLTPHTLAETIRDITIVVRSLATGALFMAMSARRDEDALLQQHALSTCTLVLVVGHALGYNPAELERLATAALLHDLSLFQLPPSAWRLLPLGATRSESDRRRYASHPALTVKLLKRYPFFDPELLEIVAHHHARADANDPSHPKRSAPLPLSTRLLGLIDRYDELISGLGHTLSLTPHHALHRLAQEAQDGAVDRALAAQFINLVGFYPIHSTVELTTHELGIVTDLNPSSPHDPIVTLTHDERGRPYPTPHAITIGDPLSPSRAIARVLPGILTYSLPVP
jgi:HD-GYP domain-containing protein (c-di-GMP phosphodiesterase class II)